MYIVNIFWSDETESAVMWPGRSEIRVGTNEWNKYVQPYIDGGITVKHVDGPVDNPASVKDYVDSVIADTSAAVKSRLLSGFKSDALGSMHHYSTDAEDQFNLLASVTMAAIQGSTQHACYDSNNVKLFRKHTAQQITKASLDFATLKLKTLEGFGRLKITCDGVMDDSLLTYPEMTAKVDVLVAEFKEHLKNS